ncbi:MAG: HEAT repeat domain-containing protein [Deltaproteobacteria bacterium]|nr:HEAT repeat domain-containing protein [Deltaproteobacteria bacterium]MBW2050966.1 HEAT repeat domain-containing protein [Deltaproteobacteria bacterium]MBW2139637.1 HEAT repeat domain-containing protein [Deltaproteobacteria bacterium]MBW2322251.1 HEAT repeat domain-containing protein [Deltaproteobacteria bacterium]
MSLKSDVRKLLADNNEEALLALLDQDRRGVGALNRFLFDTDELIRWRAITALGWVAREDPFLLEKVISRLMWTINDDSGSIGWSTPEALGEICANDSDLVEDFFPIIISKLEEKIFRQGVLWAMGRVAPDRPDLVDEAGDLIPAYLNDPDAGVRGAACWCLGRIPWVEAEDELERLTIDQASFSWYEKGQLVNKTVGQMAQAALKARRT